MTHLSTIFARTPIETDDRADVVAVLTSAFAADPVIRWMYPSARAYLAAFPRFLEAFGGLAFAQGTVTLDLERRTAAMWMAPGLAPDDAAIEACLLETVEATKLEDLFPVFEGMAAAHPDFPHWYLPWFGVDAATQGIGYGSSLMELCLAHIESDGLPVYLETPNPRNIAFYQRHGFRVTGSCRHGECPPVTFMLRDAN